MNKKGQEIVVVGMVVIILGALLLLGVYALISVFLNSGQSTDIAYGVEKNNFWTKLYLKDDHKTVYCIDKDDLNFIDIANKASINKDKVKVTYQEYVFRGSLCSSDDVYSAVVVTDIEVLK